LLNKFSNSFKKSLFLKDTMYKAGDTIPALRNFLNEIEAYTHESSRLKYFVIF
jgi:hypothetical protein